MFELFCQYITSEGNKATERAYFYTEPKCRSAIDELYNNNCKIIHICVWKRIYVNNQLLHSYIYFRV